MKRIFLVAIIATVIVFFNACRKPKYANDKNYTTHIVPLGIAQKVAQKISVNYFKNANNISRTSDEDFPILDRRISNYYSFNDENDNVALWVFNYINDSGFVVISADTWHQPICAYVEQGQFSPDDSVPGMLDEWFQKTVENIQFLRDGTYSDTAMGKIAWYHLLEQTDLSAYQDQLKVAPIDPPHDCNEGWTTTTVNPLVNTIWGQQCTYNESCPTGSCYNFCNSANHHKPTGCVATAMAQVIHYWHPSNSYSYNYNSMPVNQGNSEVQRLMSDAGDNVAMSYHCVSSGGSGANSTAIPAGLVGTSFNPGFGFASATQHSYGAGSYSTVVGNLDNGWPVLLGGYASRKNYVIFHIPTDGHEWVCDGYKQFSNECYSYLYFHMNWGWHEMGLPTDYNGWYAFDVWSNGNGNFQYARDYVYNIHL